MYLPNPSANLSASASKRVILTAVSNTSKAKAVVVPDPASTISLRDVPVKLSKRAKLTPANTEQPIKVRVANWSK